MLGPLMENSVTVTASGDDFLLAWATWHPEDPRPNPEVGRLSVLREVVRQAEAQIKLDETGGKQ